MPLNYAKDMIIDPEALDIENLTQSDLERKYIEQLSNLRKEKDFDHEEIKTIRSELIRDAYEDPKGCCGRDDGKPPTAPQTEAYYRTHVKYKQAKEDFINSQDAYLVAQDMKDNIHFTRSGAIDNLVRLHAQSYFEGPTVPRNLVDEFKYKKEKKEELAGKRNQKTKKGMTRKKEK